MNRQEKVKLCEEKLKDFNFVLIDYYKGVTVYLYDLYCVEDGLQQLINVLKIVESITCLKKNLDVSAIMGHCYVIDEVNLHFDFE